MRHLYKYYNLRESTILDTSTEYSYILDGYESFTVSNCNQLIIYLDLVKGSLTTMEMVVEFAPIVHYDLSYDAQSGNFTVGDTVKGESSGATGVIVKDTDAGTAGTLVIKTLRDGVFLDNEIITDESTGSATTNGTTSISDYGWSQEASKTISGGTSTDVALTHEYSANTSLAIPIPIMHKNIRIGLKGVGTVANSSGKLQAAIGTV